MPGDPAPDDIDAGCPDEAELESLASGQTAPSWVAEHVASCPKCAQSVDEMRQNNAFLEEMSPKLQSLHARALVSFFHVTGVMRQQRGPRFRRGDKAH